MRDPCEPKRAAVWMVTGLLVFVLFMFQTAFGVEMSFQTPASLALSKVTYDVAKFKGKDRLIFEITIKNVSSDPHRYRLRIALTNGPSAGALCPRKGKPPQISPGKEFTVKLPFLDYDKMPEGVAISLTEIKLD